MAIWLPFGGANFFRPTFCAGPKIHHVFGGNTGHYFIIAGGFLILCQPVAQLVQQLLLFHGSLSGEGLIALFPQRIAPENLPQA